VCSTCHTRPHRLATAAATPPSAPTWPPLPPPPPLAWPSAAAATTTTRAANITARLPPHATTPHTHTHREREREREPDIKVAPVRCGSCRLRERLTRSPWISQPEREAVVPAVDLTVGGRGGPTVNLTVRGRGGRARLDLNTGGRGGGRAPPWMWISPPEGQEAAPIGISPPEGHEAIVLATTAASTPHLAAALVY
jgi:hypothetical protein